VVLTFASGSDTLRGMKLTVNGNPVELPDGSTVTTLLSQLGVDGARVAVERNEDVVPRRTWVDARLSEGDRIELVTFVGGG
jgi:sulfur carrier protein